jgi:hypothetical protein
MNHPNLYTYFRHALLALSLAIVVGQTVAEAQSVNATLTGSVRDESGAFVAGANITASNPAAGIQRKTNSNEDGNFVLVQLPPGTYLLAVERTGFAPTEIKNIVLQASERVALEIKLRVGNIGDSVSVTADAGQVALKSESGERSEVLTNRQIKDLAINGRNSLALLGTLPGVVSNLAATISRTDTQNAFSVNGQREQANEITLDGASIVVAGSNRAIYTTINPDAISEVKILTSNYQAEFGKMSGAAIQIVSKSGTRDFHGTGRYFRRHDSLNANSFFSNLNRLPRTLYRYDYGGFDLGGPVLLPRKLFGPLGGFNEQRNKLFFFFSQEFYEQLLPEGARNVRVPTVAERQGDFSQTVNAQGARILLRDPLKTGTCTATNTAANPGACFVYQGRLNVIDPARFYRLGKNILNLYPEPNVPAEIGGNFFNYRSQLSSSYPRRETIMRMDYNHNANHRLSGRYAFNFDEERNAYGAFNATANWPLEGNRFRNNNPRRSLAVTLNSTLSPTLVNEFIFGYSLGGVRIGATNDGSSRRVNNLEVDLLFPTANPDDYLPNFTYGGIANQPFPATTFSGLTFNQRFRNLNFLDNVTRVISRHTFKTGIFVQKSYDERTAFGLTSSTINFSTNAANPLDTGHPYANALLGIYNNYLQQNRRPLSNFTFYNLEGYAQDTWKITQRLTLDYGLRLANYQPLYDTEDNLLYFNPRLFDPAKAFRLYRPVLVGGQRRAIDPAITAAPTAANTLTANFIGLLVPGSGDLANGIGQPQQGYARGGFDNPAIVWAPRLGFAFDLTGKGTTVLRGGFGVSYNRVTGTVVTDAVVNRPSILTPQLFFGYLSDIPQLRGGGTLAPTSAIGVSDDGNVPVTYSYSLSVQRNIGAGIIVDVAYVGNVSRHLPQQRELNAVPYGTTFTAAAQDPTRYAGGVIPATEPNLFAAHAQAGLRFSGANALPVDFLRPYRGFGAISYRDFAASGNYNSLQISANRRMSRSLTFGVAYTFSKTLGTGFSDTEGSNPFGSRQRDYRLSPFDRKHNLVVNYVYDLPRASRIFGRGASGNRFVKSIFDNWQVSGITQALSGAPFELGVGIAGVNTGQFITGSLTHGPVFLLKGEPAAGPNGLRLNPDAFVLPAIGSQGIGNRTYLRDPFVVNHDVSVFKNFPFGGEGNRYLQLRVEMFNAFNSTQFSSINTGVNLSVSNANGTFSTGTGIFNNYGSAVITNNLRPAGSTQPLGQFFGEYNGTRSPRVIQLAVKLYF